MDARVVKPGLGWPVATGLAGALVSCMALAQADGYPNRPLRLIVPFPPGGGNDILARALGQRLTEVVRQQVIVDNRGGGGGIVGAAIAATSLPDGYTTFLASLGGMAHNPALRQTLPYDPVRDFAPVTLLATSPFVLVVTPSLPAHSVKELIALARAKPGSLNFGSAGSGSSVHMTGELFRHTVGIDVVHVGFKGTAPALTDLIAGQVQFMFSTAPPAVVQVKAGKLRGLAVTGARRMPAVPELPTVAEAGVPGFEVLNWQGLVAPARTPAAIVDFLNRSVLAALGRPGMPESLSSQGLDAAGGTSAQFGALIAAEVAKYRKLVQATGIRID